MSALRSAALIALPLAASVLWALHGGRDLHWDLLHYHVYGPHGLLHHRLGRDFLPAGLQSYLNPLPHLPFYLMLTAGWHSVAIAAVLAALQGFALVLLYLISRALLGQATRVDAVLCTLLGALSVPFLSNVGRTFSDITTALPVLAALWLFCSGAARARPMGEAGGAGVLLGIAAGLKFTNGLFLIAAAAWPLLRGASRIKALGAYGLGAALGLLLAGGWWAWMLWREFGSPVFPLFNALFQAPDFPAVNASFDRYRPQDLAGYLLAPLRMALPEPMIYGELTAPDVRFVLLLALLAALPLARRRDWHSALGPMAAFFVVAYVLWLVSAFNARYATVLLLLVGPLIGALARALFPGRGFRVALVLALALQFYAVLEVSPTRLSPADPYGWARSWLGFKIPERLQREPYLYVGIDSGSYAFLAASLHPGSAFVRVRGEYALHLDGPGGNRLARLLAEHKGRVRTLGANALETGATEPQAEWVRQKDIVLGRLGLAVNAGECLPIDSDDQVDALAQWANRLLGLYSPMPKRFIMSCGLRHVPVSEAFLRGRPQADRMLDAAEQACPRAFQRGIARTELVGNLWVRTYPNTERELAWSGTQLFTVSRVTARTTVVAETRADGPVLPYRCP